MFNRGDIIENLEITGFASEGKAIARVENLVIFVENAVPGDVGDVTIYRKKKSFAEGRLINLIKPSIDRIEPFCQHFGTCGGCKWQHLTYEKQLMFKQQQVVDAFERIGHLELPAISPIIGSGKTQFYRNKLEFTFSNKSWLTKDELSNLESHDTPALGFHVPQRFDKVLDIKKCYLQDDISNEIRLVVKDYCLRNNLSFFDLKSQNGLMRNLIIRNTTSGEWMIIVVFHEDLKEEREKLLKHMIDKFPNINSLSYIINTKRNDTISDQDVRVFHGMDFILEKMENLTFRISAKSFYQTNSLQAHELYKVARSFAGLTGKEIVYDLYTGTGTIAAFVSSQSSKVIGIDYVEDAINDARQNSIDNNLKNLSFFAGDIKSVLDDKFIIDNGKPDIIITDPPRAGMHEDVIKKIISASPEKIVYISCNPSTQARDVQMLNEYYIISKVQPVDMFPHTSHVENVIQLLKKN